MSETNFIEPNKKTKYGQDGVQIWIGTVVGFDSQKEQIESGWGWRYKVRIDGDHAAGSDLIKDDELSYATCLLPTTAGSGAAYKLRSVRISQGDQVFGIRGGGQGAPTMILGVLPRTKYTKNSSGAFGVLSGFWGSGTLSDTKILSGQFNDQVGPEFLKGASGLEPGEWTKATAENPSKKIKEIVPQVKKKKNIGIGTTDNTTEEFIEITEEETEKNDVKNNAGKVVDPKEWKPGTPLNTATMEALKESFEKGEIPPVIWEEALKQASEQGLDGYEEYVIKEEIKQEVIPKKVEYKKTFIEAVNEAKNPPFDNWEKRELTKLAEKNEASLLGNGKISISREIGITFQERKDILREIKSIEGSLQFRAEVDPTQTIQAGDNAPQNLQQMIIPDSQVAITRDRLLYLTKQLKYIEDGGIVKYPGELTG
tara:strand:- start:132 stop:1409 length:1278 start_codon:yes stop_codon:yes gene_type:complete